MVICNGIGPNILQLQSLNDIVTVNNASAINYPANNIRVTILPNGQPIGFFLDYQNENPININTTSILNSRRTIKFPNVTREVATIPGKVTLKVNIVLVGNSLSPSPTVIDLIASNNGKISEVTAAANSSNIKANLIITYTYVQTAVLYKWCLINCQLNLSNKS